MTKISMTEEEKRLLKENHISYATFYRRVERWGQDHRYDACTKPVRERKDWEIDEQTKKELKKNGVSEKLYKNRLRRGESKEHALRKPKKVWHLPEEEQALLDKHGISKAVFKDRLNKGWVREDALTIPTKGLQRKPRKVKEQ